MRYSALVVAVTAFASFAVAQNETLPNGVQPCCEVDPDLIPTSQKRDWCLAERNTCREACGSTASGGNTCNDETLDFTCQCTNGTNLTMTQFEQSVPGQMCRFWFSGCVNATNEDKDLQSACEAVRDSSCGTELTNGDSTSSSATASPTATTTGGESSEQEPTSSGAVPSESSPGAALSFGQNYGTPLMAGGLMAVFGLAL